MGLRRKKILPPLRRRIEELLETRKPGEVFEILQPTRERVSLSAIYKIRRSKSKKVRETGAPQKPLDFPSLLKQLNLPSWINQEQLEHLEGKEQRDERGGMDIITYPRGIGIRQQLEFFKGCFLDINPRSQSFWRPLDDENVMAQLHGHLRDKAFWEQVEGSEGFIKKAKECEAPLDATRGKFTSAGKKLAERTSAAGPTPTASVTNEWARDVCHRALGRPLGLEDLPEYGETSSELTSYSSILYRGPDVAKAKQKHQKLVEDFINSRKEFKEFNLIVSLMKDLQNLRQQIIARINQCLQDREYIHYYCPSCPVYPYIKDFPPQERT